MVRIITGLPVQTVTDVNVARVNKVNIGDAGAHSGQDLCVTIAGTLPGDRNEIPTF